MTMNNKEAAIIIGNIPVNGDDCYTICEYQEAKARAIQALESSTWKTGYPPKNDRYLVTIDYMDRSVLQILGYSNNLSKVDKYNFKGNTNPGWYSYDGEYGYYTINNVVAWMEKPEVYKGDEK